MYILCLTIDWGQLTLHHARPASAQCCCRCTDQVSSVWSRHENTKTTFTEWLTKHISFYSDKLLPRFTDTNSRQSFLLSPVSLNVTAFSGLKQPKSPPILHRCIPKIAVAQVSPCLAEASSDQARRWPEDSPTELSKRALQIAREDAIFASLQRPAVHCACAGYRIYIYILLLLFFFYILHLVSSLQYIWTPHLSARGATAVPGLIKAASLPAV